MSWHERLRKITSYRLLNFPRLFIYFAPLHVELIVSIWRIAQRTSLSVQYRDNHADLISDIFDLSETVYLSDYGLGFVPTGHCLLESATAFDFDVGLCGISTETSRIERSSGGS